MSMRHYEIVFLVHPDQSSQVPAMVERYQTLIKESGGRVHRFEDWGRRPTAYPIKEKGSVQKAHYLLMNVEVSPAVIAELKSAFGYNDAILRSLFLKRSNAITTPSAMVKESDSRRHSDHVRKRNDVEETIDDES